MHTVKYCVGRALSKFPGMLQRGLPSIVLGTLFNVLDAVSTGLLLFPGDDDAGTDQFKSLQIQGLSMYLLSTVLSQAVMTLGGSRFPGAMGAMLIEILPLLRGVGSDIRDALGSDHPALVPTVFATYALTSLLTGFTFVGLGFLKLGNFVAYFPQTVLTGAIGAIGFSLFMLGLELTVPGTSPSTSSPSDSVPSGQSHLAILSATFLPPFILSISKRSKLIKKYTGGIVHKPYYVPLYLACIPTIFWIIAGVLQIPRESLIAHGWLFRLPPSVETQKGIGTDWIYWKEFDFSKVEWWALKHATTNIILLVVIGVLNLPIYVPALAFTLDMSYDMNHEFLGQGAANLLAGMAGTVPNVLQYSYGVFITRAGGGRFELGIVTVLTFILFLTSSLLLPYVPTILAAGMVMFLGIELAIEAIWESALSLVLLEYLVVLGTLLACTFAGFAPGFVVGIATAAVVHFTYGILDSRARVVQWEEWNETHKHLSASTGTAESHQYDNQMIPITPLNHSPFPIRLPSDPLDHESRPSSPSVHNFTPDVLERIKTRIIVLTGYVFFASIPTLERNILDQAHDPRTVLIDLTTVHRLETAAVHCFDRSVRDLAPRGAVLIVAGVRKGSGVHADFERAGVHLLFDDKRAGESSDVPQRKGIRTFESRVAALRWCQNRFDRTLSLQDESMLIENADGSNSDLVDLTLDAAIYDEFCKMFGFDTTPFFKMDGENNLRITSIFTTVKSTLLSSETLNPTSKVRKFLRAGGRITSYNAGESIQRSSCVSFVVSGLATIQSQSSLTRSHAYRLALHDLLMMLPRECLLAIRTQLGNIIPWKRLHRLAELGPGDVIPQALDGSEVEVIAKTRCVCVLVDVLSDQDTNAARNELVTWAKDLAERKATGLCEDEVRG